MLRIAVVAKSLANQQPFDDHPANNDRLEKIMSVTALEPKPKAEMNLDRKLAVAM